MMFPPPETINHQPHSWNPYERPISEASTTSWWLNQPISKISGQISIIPKPEIRGFWGSSLIKPPFRVTSADVVIICPEI